MSENSRVERAPQGQQAKKYGEWKATRREFLRRAATIGGLIVAAGVGLPVLAPRVAHADDEIDNPSEGLPEDVLSEEELAKAHIRIIPTEEVKLYLRPSVFKFDVFADAKEGNLKEVVVVLVDHPNLSWNTRNKMTEEARLVFQTMVDDPRVNSREFRSTELTPDEREKAIEEESENNHLFGVTRKIHNPFLIPRGEHYNDVNAFFGTTERNRRYDELITSQPEMINKVYIFVAVGVETKPHPSQSYPSPDDFEEIPGARFKKNSYLYKSKGRPTPTSGHILRHEVAHYDLGGIMKDEYGTDIRMFKYIEFAWKRYQEKEDIGYPFIFVTSEGITFTKQRKSQSTNEHKV